MGYNEYQVVLPVYEGPFDLLYRLIEEDEIDIRDIPIAKITAEYLDYLAGLQELKLEVAADFLLMAATLIQIKARMLLPETKQEDGDDGEDPRQALVGRLLAYKKHKIVAGQLLERYKEQQRYHSNPVMPTSRLKIQPRFTRPLGVDAEELSRIAAGLFRARQERKQVRTVVCKRVDLGQRIVSLLVAVRQGGRVNFRRFISGSGTRAEVVASFLALLELIRRGRLNCSQAEDGDIVIWSNENR